MQYSVFENTQKQMKRESFNIKDHCETEKREGTWRLRWEEQQSEFQHHDRPSVTHRTVQHTAKLAIPVPPRPENHGKWSGENTGNAYYSRAVSQGDANKPWLLFRCGNLCYRRSCTLILTFSLSQSALRTDCSTGRNLQSFCWRNYRA